MSLTVTQTITTITLTASSARSVTWDDLADNTIATAITRIYGKSYKCERHLVIGNNVTLTETAGNTVFWGRDTLPTDTTELANVRATGDVFSVVSGGRINDSGSHHHFRMDRMPTGTTGWVILDDANGRINEENVTYVFVGEYAGTSATIVKVGQCNQNSSSVNCTVDTRPIDFTGADRNSIDLRIDYQGVTVRNIITKNLYGHMIVSRDPSDQASNRQTRMSLNFYDDYNPVIIIGGSWNPDGQRIFYFRGINNYTNNDIRFEIANPLDDADDTDTTVIFVEGYDIDEDDIRFTNTPDGSTLRLTTRVDVTVFDEDGDPVRGAIGHIRDEDNNIVFPNPASTSFATSSSSSGQILSTPATWIASGDSGRGQDVVYTPAPSESRYVELITRSVYGLPNRGAFLRGGFASYFIFPRRDVALYNGNVQRTVPAYNDSRFEYDTDLNLINLDGEVTDIEFYGFIKSRHARFIDQDNAFFEPSFDDQVLRLGGEGLTIRSGGRITSTSLTRALDYGSRHPTGRNDFISLSRNINMFAIGDNMGSIRIWANEGDGGHVPSYYVAYTQDGTTYVLHSNGDFPDLTFPQDFIHFSFPLDTELEVRWATARGRIQRLVTRPDNESQRFELRPIRGIEVVQMPNSIDSLTDLNNAFDAITTSSATWTYGSGALTIQNEPLITTRAISYFLQSQILENIGTIDVDLSVTYDGGTLNILNTSVVLVGNTTRFSDPSDQIFCESITLPNNSPRQLAFIESADQIVSVFSYPGFDDVEVTLYDYSDGTIHTEATASDFYQLAHDETGKFGARFYFRGHRPTIYIIDNFEATFIECVKFQPEIPHDDTIEAEVAADVTAGRIVFSRTDSVPNGDIGTVNITFNYPTGTLKRLTLNHMAAILFEGWSSDAFKHINFQRESTFNARINSFGLSFVNAVPNEDTTSSDSRGFINFYLADGIMESNVSLDFRIDDDGKDIFPDNDAGFAVSHSPPPEFNNYVEVDSNRGGFYFSYAPTNDLTNVTHVDSSTSVRFNVQNGETYRVLIVATGYLPWIGDIEVDTCRKIDAVLKRNFNIGEEEDDTALAEFLTGGLTFAAPLVVSVTPSVTTGYTWDKARFDSFINILYLREEARAFMIGQNIDRLVDYVDGAVALSLFTTPMVLRLADGVRTDPDDPASSGIGMILNFPEFRSSMAAWNVDNDLGERIQTNVNFVEVDINGVSEYFLDYFDPVTGFGNAFTGLEGASVTIEKAYGTEYRLAVSAPRNEPQVVALNDNDIEIDLIPTPVTIDSDIAAMVQGHFNNGDIILSCVRTSTTVARLTVLFHTAGTYLYGVDAMSELIALIRESNDFAACLSIQNVTLNFNADSQLVIDNIIFITSNDVEVKFLFEMVKTDLTPALENTDYIGDIQHSIGRVRLSVIANAPNVAYTYRYLEDDTATEVFVDGTLNVDNEIVFFEQLGREIILVTTADESDPDILKFIVDQETDLGTCTLRLGQFVDRDVDVSRYTFTTVYRPGSDDSPPSVLITMTDTAGTTVIEGFFGNLDLAEFEQLGYQIYNTGAYRRIVASNSGVSPLVLCGESVSINTFLSVFFGNAGAMRFLVFADYNPETGGVDINQLPVSVTVTGIQNMRAAIRLNVRGIELFNIFNNIEGETFTSVLGVVEENAVYVVGDNIDPLDIRFDSSSPTEFTLDPPLLRQYWTQNELDAIDLAIADGQIAFMNTSDNTQFHVVFNPTGETVYTLGLVHAIIFRAKQTDAFLTMLDERQSAGVVRSIGACFAFNIENGFIFRYPATIADDTSVVLEMNAESSYVLNPFNSQNRRVSIRAIEASTATVTSAEFETRLNSMEELIRSARDDVIKTV